MASKRSPIRVAIVAAATAVVTGCASPQPSSTPADSPPEPATATPTAPPTPTQSQSPPPEPTSEPSLPPITEAPALLPDGFTVVSEFDGSAPDGGMTSLRTVAGGMYLDAVFACEGRGSIEIALEDATAALPSPGLPDTRQLGAVETSCSTEPEGLTLRGPERDAAIGIVVSAPEDARYWVVVGAPTEETRP